MTEATTAQTACRLLLSCPRAATSPLTPLCAATTALPPDPLRREAAHHSETRRIQPGTAGPPRRPRADLRLWRCLFAHGTVVAFVPAGSAWVNTACHHSGMVPSV